MPAAWFHSGVDAVNVEVLIEERRAARAAKNFARADEIRKTLEADGIILEDSAAGTTWRKQ